MLPVRWLWDLVVRGMRRARDFQCGLQNRARPDPPTAIYIEDKWEIYRNWKIYHYWAANYGQGVWEIYHCLAASPIRGSRNATGCGMRRVRGVLRGL